jgi:hypothetical protein
LHAIDTDVLNDEELGHLAAFPLLRELVLQRYEHSSWTDAGLRALGRLGRLATRHALDVRGRETLSDAGLRHLSGLTSLRQLRLSGSRVTDAGFGVVSLLAGLTELDVAFGAMTDEALRHVAMASESTRTKGWITCAVW